MRSVGSALLGLALAACGGHIGGGADDADAGDEADADDDPTADAAAAADAGVTQAWLVDLGTDKDLPGYNAFAVPDGDGKVELADTAGTATDVTLRLVAPFYFCTGVNEDGADEPDDAVGLDPKATADSFYGCEDFGGQTRTEVRLALEGLDVDARYGLRLFASRLGAGGDVRETSFAVAGDEGAGPSVVDAAENTVDVVVFDDLAPNEGGSIEITLTKGAGNTNANGFFYLNAFALERE
jgi:hypothetical protein